MSIPAKWKLENPMIDRRNPKKLAFAAATALIALGAAGLTGCASTAEAETTGDELAEQLADVAKTDPQTGEKVMVDSQAQVVKALGEAGKLTVAGETQPSFEITVHSVEVLDSCILRGYGERITPENGAFLLLEVSASLAASAAEAVAEEIALMPLDASVFGTSPGANRAVSYDTDTIAAYSCEVDGALDIAVGAGDQVRGKLVLDVPDASGQVIYDPEKTGGWTWNY
ncbi:hypothetical protein CIK76_13205 [Glutamicibacter sp. BW80]|uniref:hypothetical protein n=1 Tax=Glutamicibacter sp. BW80 TaxID=2024404 RepID=UPI000BB91FC9|nr:hypothetical protein [Glutamicibacter sp. BW80]PCC28211.1 hypothetical protein CIK76_13205 [Glutamicibacter sp. BW80]